MKPKTEEEGTHKKEQKECNERGMGQVQVALQIEVYVQMKEKSALPERLPSQEETIDLYLEEILKNLSSDGILET